MPDYDFRREHERVLGTYARPIAHLRQQFSLRRLCLIFGAGAGYDLGFPQWRDLLKRVGTGLSGFADAERTAENEVNLAQLLVKLFEYEFVATHPQPALDDARGQKAHRAAMQAEWRDRLHDALYRDVVTGDERAFLEKDCYYKTFLDIIKGSAVTITYNFDDSIERFLSAARSAAEKTKKRGYTTIHDEHSQMPATAPVIYHPNGFLAHLKVEKPSTQLTLSEESFAEQLTDSIAGRHAVLHSELSQKTCLLIGCSLSDPTLSYFLKRNAVHHPGHFHYHVHWTGRDGENGPCSAAYAERLFELYNLVTLNLSTREIAALGDLLSYPSDFLLEAMRERDIDGMFTYIVTGAVGSGKSSVISHFRSLKQHDEWLEPRRPGMEKQVDKLSDDDVKGIDEWVDEQFALKNRVLYGTENAIGLHILDRGPLDPLAFTKDGRVARRAKKLKSAICRKSKLQKEIVPAHVIVLLADPLEIAIRALSRGKQFSAEALEKQQEELLAAYGRDPGVTIIDTRGLGVEQVVRRVARLVHFQQYTEINLTTRIDELQEPQGQLHFPDLD